MKYIVRYLATGEAEPFEEYVSRLHAESRMWREQAYTQLRETQARQPGVFGKWAMEAAMNVGSVVLPAKLVSVGAKCAGEVTAALEGYAAAESAPMLGESALSRLGGSLLRGTADVGAELLRNPMATYMSMGAMGRSYVRATESGATRQQATANAVMTFLTEYAVNRMFTGTPYADGAGRGYVETLAEYVGKRSGSSRAMNELMAFIGQTGRPGPAAAAANGIENMLSCLAEPLWRKLTWDPDTDLATADELWDALEGGVTMSMLLQNVSATAWEANMAIRRLTGMLDAAAGGNAMVPVTGSGSAMVPAGSGWDELSPVLPVRPADDGLDAALRLAQAEDVTDEEGLPLSDSRDRLNKIDQSNIMKLNNGFASFPKSDRLSRDILNVKPYENYYDVAMHGTSTSVAFGVNDMANMSPRLLANVIRHRPDYDGQPVRLLSCSTGKEVEGDYCFAEELANCLGVPVMAPTDILYMWPDGSLRVAGGQPMQFRIFYPNERGRIG